jgi:tRNA(Phe) wybutosine-synthesizing methylase Tyw3
MVKGTSREVTVEVDGVQVIRHPLGKNFEYEVTRQDIEMLTERAMAQAEEDEEAKADADANVEAASINFDLEVDDALDSEDSDEYAD